MDVNKEGVFLTEEEAASVIAFARQVYIDGDVEFRTNEAYKGREKPSIMTDLKSAMEKIEKQYGSN